MGQIKHMLFLALAVSGLTAPAFSLPPPSVFIDSPTAAVRAGEGVTVSLSPPELLHPGWACVWRATLGAVMGHGAMATFTAGDIPGYAVISVDILDGDALIATRHLALLVFRQFVMVKADDLVSYDTTWPEAWDHYLDFMGEARGLKHSVGLITKSLEHTTLAEATDYTANLRAQDDSGLVEIWHHGFDHSGAEVEEPEPMEQWHAPLRQEALVAEFYNRPYAYQKEHLDRGVAWARDVAGISLRTFGPPYGLADATTAQVIAENPQIEVLFTAPEGTDRRLLPLDELLVEVPTGYPSYAQFQARHNTAPPLTILQIHPGFTEPDGAAPFLERFDEWMQIVDQLVEEGATFIQPYEYHLLYGEKLLPLHPRVDSDGDGASDAEEGPGDEDGDGLPDFLDPLRDGAAGLRVRNVVVERVAPGRFEIRFDLIGEAGESADISAFYLDASGNEVALEHVTGELAGLVPAEGYALQWDAMAQLGAQEIASSTIRLVPTSPTPASPAMVQIAEGTFTQGCRDCSEGDSYPRFAVSLDRYAIGQYEITNAHYAEALNYALAQGYLQDVDGVPYAGGDVYQGGQMVLGVLLGECQIDFDGSAFVVETRDEQPMDEHPVTCVTWYGAVAFCNWQSELAGLTPAYEIGGRWALRYPFTNGYRLPTEAEWERAAAWDGAAQWLYGTSADTISIWEANYYYSNPMGFTALPLTAPVGSYPAASPAGAFDMSGNVAEWVHDKHTPYSEQAAPLHNPRGLLSRPKRVARGGAWSDEEAALMTSAREQHFANHASGRVGFRVARSLRGGTGRSASFAIDTRAPELIDIALEGEPGADSFTLEYTIAFSEPVNGLDAAMLSFATTGTVESAPAVVSLETDGAVWQVQVETGIMEGSIALELSDPGGAISDRGGNPLATATARSDAFAVNTLAPAVRDVTLAGNPARNAAEVEFEVAFSKEVTGVGPEAFEIESSGNIAFAPQVTAVSGEGASRRVTVAVHAMQGRLGLIVVDAEEAIRDLADRPLRRRAASGLVHEADTIPPRLEAIALSGDPAPNASSLEFHVTFSEAVQGIDANSFALEHTGTVEESPEILQIGGSGAEYHVRVDTGLMDGTLGLALATPSIIGDAAGNALALDLTAGGSAAIDTIAPQCMGLTLLNDPAANASELVYTALFSEVMQGVDEGDFIALAIGSVDVEPELVSVVDADGGAYTITTDTGEVEGANALRFHPEGVTDKAGNVLAGVYDSELHPTDTRPPRLLLAELLSPSPTAANTAEFRLVFSEPVSGLHEEGAAHLDITATGLSFDAVDTTFDENLYTFRIVISGIAGSSGSISVLPSMAGGITDQNGNPLAPVTVEAAVVQIDRAPPQARCQRAVFHLDENGTAVADAALFDRGSTDDSGGEVFFSVPPFVYTCETLGTFPLTVTVSDALGNSTVCETAISIDDPLGVCVSAEGEAEMEGNLEGLLEGAGEAEGADSDGEAEEEGEAEGAGEGDEEGEGEGEGAALPAHSADWHDGPDGRIDFMELLRVVQLYNAGGYCCAAESNEDGFIPGDCDARECARHSADYDAGPWVLSLSEMLRVVQLYNVGGFTACGESEAEDGFCLPRE
jgi:formylglycine-generating enzyme required for sulfatase activity